MSYLQRVAPTRPIPCARTTSFRLMPVALLAATALMALPLSAQAQSNVTIYGVMDVGVEHLTNVAAGTSLTRVPGLTGSAPSRFGFRGTEDLGGGLKANFVLEGGVMPDSGASNQAGRLFGRQSWVGLSGRFGAVMLGRQYTMLGNGMLDGDIMGPNAYGTSALDFYLGHARVDNSIGYLGQFGQVSVGGTYSFGRDTANGGPSPAGTNCAGELATDSRACREWSLLVQYKTPVWGVAAAVDNQRGAPGAFAGLVSSAKEDQRTVVSGFYKFGDVKVGAGIMRRRNEGSAATPRSDLTFVGVSVPVMTTLTLDAQAHRIDYKNSPNAATLLSARAQYHFSKRTTVYASAGHIANQGALANGVSSGQAGGAPAAGGSQRGLLVGVRHFF